MLDFDSKDRKASVRLKPPVPRCRLQSQNSAHPFGQPLLVSRTHQGVAGFLLLIAAVEVVLHQTQPVFRYSQDQERPAENECYPYKNRHMTWPVQIESYLLFGQT